MPLLQAYADRIVIRQDGMIVGEHPSRFGRGGSPRRRTLELEIRGSDSGGRRVAAGLRWSRRANSTPPLSTKEVISSNFAGNREILAYLEAIRTIVISITLSRTYDEEGVALVFR